MVSKIWGVVSLIHKRLDGFVFDFPGEDNWGVFSRMV